MPIAVYAYVLAGVSVFCAATSRFGFSLVRDWYEYDSVQYSQST